MRSIKMVRCIHFQFIVLLITWRKQSILGSDVDLKVADTTCVGNNVTLKCIINPFTTIPSATWSRNGSTALTTCTSSAFCTQDDLTINNVKYSFSGSSTGIQVAFQIQLVENDIEWICSHNATPYRYTFNVLDTCDNPCSGIQFACIVLIIFNMPEVLEIIVLILIWCRCFCTQKVTINVQTKYRLKEATYEINKDKRNREMKLRKDIHAFNYSCMAYGGQSLNFTFQSENSQLSFSFMISDDLLCVQIGQNVTLPTIFHVSAQQLLGDGNEWFKNKVRVEIVDNYERIGFIRLGIQHVDQPSFGIYDCIMEANELEGCTIKISNMRVTGCSLCTAITYSKPCLYLVLCAVVNLVFGVASVLIVALQNSNDGYCVEVIVIILAVIIPKVIFTPVIVILICKLSMERTGKEKSDRCSLLSKCGCAVTPDEKQTLEPYPKEGRLETTTGRKTQLEPINVTKESAHF